MRYAIAIACLFLTGCGDLLFVEPIATKEDSYFDPSLIGTWSDQGDTIITVSGENRASYEILVINAKNGNQFKLLGQFASYGDEQILEVADAEGGIFTVPAHVWIDVRKTGTGIQLHFLDSKWFQDKAQQSGLAFFKSDGHPVVIAPAEPLRTFAKQFGLKPEARGDAMELVPLKKKK